MKKNVTRLATLLVALFSLPGCSPAVPREHTQRVVLHVEGDAKSPLEGAAVTFDSKVLARTARDGNARVRFAGREGDSIRMNIVCPDGYAPVGSSSVDVLVRGTEDAGRAPEFRSRCTRIDRRVVIALRAVNGPNLPVLFLGREVGRTDADGAATIAIDAKTGDEIDLVLDTRDAPKLHPQSPSVRVTAGQQDVTAVEQRFIVDKPVKKRFVAARAAVPRAL